MLLFGNVQNVKPLGENRVFEEYSVSNPGYLPLAISPCVPDQLILRLIELFCVQKLFLNQGKVRLKQIIDLFIGYLLFFIKRSQIF